MSGLVIPVLLVAIAIGVVALLGVSFTDMVKTQMVSDSIDVINAIISNTDTSSWLTISVKNSGNSEITDLVVTVNGFEDSNYDGTQYTFSPDSIRPSKSSSVTGELPELISDGKTMLVIITGNTTSGGTISETETIRP